jgi:hypothetical protein
MELFKGEINILTFSNRLKLVFEKRLNRIVEIIEFDRTHHIQSTFFFGMDNLLGLSYKRNEASDWIRYVIDNSFDAGVHGIEIENFSKMEKELRDFKSISLLPSFGVRTHYVRYNNLTFKKMSDLGYLFDSSEFNKVSLDLKEPYRIGLLWEFPLYLMDGYFLKGNLKDSKTKTVQTINAARDKNLEYFTFLFHDYLFNDNLYPKHAAYYKWFVNYCETEGLSFISYRDAIHELERRQLNA